jgi:hypothetical protein
MCSTVIFVVLILRHVAQHPPPPSLTSFSCHTKPDNEILRFFLRGQAYALGLYLL